MGILQLIVNQVAGFGRRGGFANAKVSSRHNFQCDYGWPERLGFAQFYAMYERNSLATAGVDKTIAKTWETLPELWEDEKPLRTDEERAIAEHFADNRLWQGLMNTDRRSMVGAYAGAILIIGDGRTLREPVDRVSGGISSLYQIIPAWEGQLTPATYDQDEKSPTYGQPTLYSFNEASVGQVQGVARSVQIHPDRVIIWSEDGTIYGRSALEPGYNDLLDAEKVKGAGGEGFWQTSRGAPVIEAAAGMTPEDLIKMFNSEDAREAVEKINTQVSDFRSGFHQALLLGGLTAKPLQISLPQPMEFFNVPAMSFAASISMPFRVMLGNETGERASTEDAREWAKTNMSRRRNLVIPCLRDLVKRLVKWGMISNKPWVIGWGDLTEATASEKMERGVKMADINSKTPQGDEPAFLPDEIREAAGFATLQEAMTARYLQNTDPPEDRQV